MKSLLVSASVIALVFFATFAFTLHKEVPAAASIERAAADVESGELVPLDLLLTPQGNFENNTNRPGSDYRDYETTGDAAQCANDCANDPTCRAFTWVRPGIQGRNAHCWLKSSVPGATQNSCCISGVKSGGNTSGGLEVNVDRRGGDYKDYELRDNNPNHCRDDCMNDPNCNAFTFLRPSYRGPYGHCFLKNSVPNPTQNACCISGVLRSGGGGGSNTGGTLIGDWIIHCCNDSLGWTLSIAKQQGNTFSGSFSANNGGGAVTNGQLRGNTIEFDRSGSGWKQHWSARLVNDGRGLRMINGIWTGDYLDQFHGRNNWHAEKK